MLGDCSPLFRCVRLAAKKLSWGDLQNVGKHPDNFQADVSLSALDPADVGTIDASRICQILRRNTAIVPDAAQIGRESMAEVHASARASTGQICGYRCCYPAARGREAT